MQPRPRSPGSPDPSGRHGRSADNVGTVYKHVGCGGAKGVGQRRYLYAKFVPSAPADASALHVCNDVLGVQFTVDLCLPGQPAADGGSGGSSA